LTAIISSPSAAATAFNIAINVQTFMLGQRIKNANLPRLTLSYKGAGSSMIEQDTIRLLRECDAGVKMGVASIDDVLDQVHSDTLRDYLTECKKQHEQLKDEIQTLLDKYHDDGKEPNPIAKGMSWIKTNMKMGMDNSDQTIADLMTDGCNMGVKSLNQYLNQYEAADEVSKDIAKRLIHLEEQLAVDIRKFL
jgi:hypothetical protein